MRGALRARVRGCGLSHGGPGAGRAFMGGLAAGGWSRGPRCPWVSSSAGRAGAGSLAGVVGGLLDVAASATECPQAPDGLRWCLARVVGRPSVVAASVTECPQAPDGLRWRLAQVVGRPSVVAAPVTDVLKRRTGLILPVSGEGDRDARQAQQAVAGAVEPRRAAARAARARRAARGPAGREGSRPWGGRQAMEGRQAVRTAAGRGHGRPANTARPALEGTEPVRRLRTQFSPSGV